MAQLGSLERLYQTYKDRVEFLIVYISEAHPGSILDVPTADGKTELQIVGRTSTAEERLRNLRQIIQLVGLNIPAGIDDDRGSARRAYAGWPDRLYAIGADGKIAYKGGPGPFGFKVPEIATWLQENVK